MLSEKNTEMKLIIIQLYLSYWNTLYIYLIMQLWISGFFLGQQQL